MQKSEKLIQRQRELRDFLAQRKIDIVNEQAKKEREMYLRTYNEREELKNKLRILMLKTKRRQEARAQAREIRAELKTILENDTHINRLRELIPLLESPIYTRKEVAEALGVKPRTLYGYIQVLRNNGFEVAKMPKGNFRPWDV